MPTPNTKVLSAIPIFYCPAMLANSKNFSPSAAKAATRPAAEFCRAAALDRKKGEIIA